VDLVIPAERAVIDGRPRPAAVAVADGVIRAVGPIDADYPATEQIRLAGAAAPMPGFVDTPVHINEPGTDWEGFATATAAAAAVGMRILVLNPNTSESMTAEIVAAAATVAAEGTEIVARNPRFGATAIDSAAESYLSAVGTMDLVATMLAMGEFDYHAVVLAGFGEHGKDALQEMLPVPVLDIAEAAAHVAHLIGRRFSVVTTLAARYRPSRIG
jgi:dihydroorotase-like cyclic amidohydrolase